MIVDASVNPVIGDKELRHQLGSPWGTSRLPPALSTRYEPPFDELAVPPDRAGDSAAAAELLFGKEGGVDAAVVTPMTRGLLPNPQQAAAVAHAVNTWVAEQWLACPEADGRFTGSIRVSVIDVATALEEIESWVDDPRFVQIAVPLRVFLPYGDDFYFPIWRAAAELDLPVCIYDDGANVVEHPETPIGPVRFFAEKHAIKPLAAIVHLSSFITAGVFERLPGLRVVVGDGGVDVARPMFWRIDRDWRQGRSEIPWVERPPSSYLREHIRFISQPEDARPDGRRLDDDLMRIVDAENLVLFGSHYPYWDYVEPTSALSDWPEAVRKRILAENTLEFTPRLASYLSSLTSPRPA